MQQAISSFNDTATPSKRISFESPLSASEAFKMGITMENLMLNIYQAVAQRCDQVETKRVLQQVALQAEEQIKALKECHRFALNSELGRFYNSGGVLLETDINQAKVAESYPLIMRNLEIFFDKMQEIEADLLDKSDLGTYFQVKNPQQAADLCAKAKQNSAELYNRLARLYPQTEISEAFEEMARIINN